jgi:hypothetical protein
MGEGVVHRFPDVQSPLREGSSCRPQSVSRCVAEALPSEHADKLRDILARLDAVKNASDMDVPGLRIHPLKGREIMLTTTEKETDPCR